MTFRSLFSFVLLNGLLWLLLSLGYFSVTGFVSDPLGLLFTAVFLIGHLFLFAWACGLLSAPFLFIGPRATRVACITTGGIFSLFLALDLLVYSQYRFHISPAMLALFFGPAGREIFDFSTALWCGVTVGVLGIFGVQFLLTWLAKRWAPGKRLISVVLAGWLLAFGAYNALYAWGKFNMVPSIVSQRTVLPFANPLSANSRLRKMGFEPKKDPYSTPPAGTLNYPLAPLACNPQTPVKNVLIILVESWRADSVTPAVMPFLSAWTHEKGVTYFQDHLSGGNATEAGVFSLFYSMPYAYWNDFTSRQQPPVLVSHALENGYTPAIFSSGKLNSPTFHQNVFATVPHLRLESQGVKKWERDEDAVHDFEQFLHTRNPQTPFFGFIFLDAPHGASYPPQDAVFTPAQEVNYLLVNKNTDPTPYKNQYQNSLHFVDRLLKRIVDDLQKQGVLENTLIILTGDHGQEINDTRHNFWGHNSNFARYQTHVPLLVWDASRPGGAVTYRTTHYDVAPTVLQSVYGCTNPTRDYSIGYALFDPTPRPFVLISSYTKKAIRTADQLTVLDAYGAVETYNAEYEKSAGADPSVLKEALQTFAQFYQ